MNIHIQCCGIVLLLIVLIFYMNQKKLNLITGKIFMLTVAVEFVSIVLDVLSIVAISHMNQLPMFLVELVSKLYPASLVATIACCLMYVYVDVFYQSTNYRYMIKMYMGILSLVLITILLLPIKYHYVPEKKELYTYGSCIIATYIAALCYIIANLVVLIKQRHKINPSRFKAVLIWLMLWIGAAAIQGTHPQLLLVSYAACIGILIVYLKLENPEANIDRKTGLYNQNALKLYLKQLYLEKRDFTVISITLEHTLGENTSTDEYHHLSDLINYLKKYKDAKIFKRNDDILLVMNRITKVKDTLYDMKAFLEKWSNSKMDNSQVKMLVLLDAQRVHNEKDLLYLIQYTRGMYMDYKDNTLAIIDKETIHHMYQEKDIKKHIRRAIDTESVEVFYQPIYSTKEKTFVSAEALARIRDDEGKIISPAEFIPIAEKTGLIIKLGEIIFDKVCAFMIEKDIKQYGIQYIEVNLSVVQCSDIHLAKRFIRIMEKHQIDPKMINLEITESASLEKKRILLRNIKKLMEYGTSFSLDDFGTGQSNLNYIMDMPVDIVKFDREMTNAYFVNSKGTYIMDAAIHMIHGMGLHIVSEGVETEEQLRTIEQLGIKYVQGYYFSKPLPEVQFLEFVESA